ncbi:hypothetical protein [Candidatus Mycoplasma haematohominis]|uniref:Uncharacterized protein n=1 Tax=Candidatus Mycoplasma haematohominis TaxID=1494318 RepID=A0A478FQX7_9MOLU|nr:hypothetical protein [Candidatus Mycoplasma haemohominis]GCE63792.1 hypothetical protein MHSWG343_07990 [Candidatus Mycoplasma haemohominis]
MASTALTLVLGGTAIAILSGSSYFLGTQFSWETGMSRVDSNKTTFFSIALSDEKMHGKEYVGGKDQDDNNSVDKLIKNYNQKNNDYRAALKKNWGSMNLKDSENKKPEDDLDSLFPNDGTSPVLSDKQTAVADFTKAWCKSRKNRTWKTEKQSDLNVFKEVCFAKE